MFGFVILLSFFAIDFPIGPHLAARLLNADNTALSGNLPRGETHYAVQTFAAGLNDADVSS